MAIRMYDLAAADETIRFSPYCWRTKMALRHKGLDFETVPWRFTDKDAIGASGGGRVPVIVDGDRWIGDSWTIALHLDETYPERPLMDGAGARSLCRFVAAWCDLTLHKAIRPLTLLNVLAIADEKDRRYFRESREKMIGMTLEACCADPEAARAGLRDALAPAETALSAHPFLGGESPCYADYALFGSLQWVRTVSGETPLAGDSAAGRWFESILDLDGGFARAAPTARR